MSRKAVIHLELMMIVQAVGVAGMVEAVATEAMAEVAVALPISRVTQALLRSHQPHPLPLSLDAQPERQIIPVQ